MHPEITDSLGRAAASNGLSIPDLVNQILRDWLTQNGYLPGLLHRHEQVKPAAAMREVGPEDEDRAGHEAPRD